MYTVTSDLDSRKPIGQSETEAHGDQHPPRRRLAASNVIRLSSGTTDASLPVLSRSDALSPTKR